MRKIIGLIPEQKIAVFVPYDLGPITIVPGFDPTVQMQTSRAGALHSRLQAPHTGAK